MINIVFYSAQNIRLIYSGIRHHVKQNHIKISLKAVLHSSSKMVLKMKMKMKIRDAVR